MSGILYVVLYRKVRHKVCLTYLCYSSTLGTITIILFTMYYVLTSYLLLATFYAHSTYSVLPVGVPKNTTGTEVESPQIPKYRTA
jgi:hypothetical protein